MIHHPHPSDPPKLVDNQLPEDEAKDISVHGPSDLPFPLHQELVDLIIDILCDNRLWDRLRRHRTLYRATLCACCLVAKGWTVRAQRAVFRWAELHSTANLYSFAETLRASPHLAGNVQRLTLSQRIQYAPTKQQLYSPDCPEVLFPTVLAGLLPNLRRLAFDEPLNSEAVAPSTWPVPDASRQFRLYVPFHTRFPFLLSSSGFTHLEELHLCQIIFQTFNDFARILHVFRQLRTLYCSGVNWITLGVLLPSFMSTFPIIRSNAEFLPVLENLTVYSMAQHGSERLLSGLALTMSLRALSTYFPDLLALHYTGPSIDPATGKSDRGLDLSPFPHLSQFEILGIAPYSFPKDHYMLSVLYDMLESWNATSSHSLSLFIKPDPFSQELKRNFTKQDYLKFLEGIGIVVEEAFTSRNSSIPIMHIYLEIPQNAETSLEELEHEAILRFPKASKAGQLKVKAYTSELDIHSWKSSTIDTDGPSLDSQ